MMLSVGWSQLHLCLGFAFSGSTSKRSRYFQVHRDYLPSLPCLLQGEVLLDNHCSLIILLINLTDPREAAQLLQRQLIMMQLERPFLRFERERAQNMCAVKAYQAEHLIHAVTALAAVTTAIGSELEEREPKAPKLAPSCQQTPQEITNGSVGGSPSERA